MMAFGDLGSREFKVMLDARKFGTRVELEAKAMEFWKEIEAHAEADDVATLKSDPRFGAPRVRRVEFFDTPDGDVYGRDYALRRRVEPANGETKITLKKRHADWVLALHNGISEKKAKQQNDDGDFVPKFEEDVKPAVTGRQRSLFSNSSTWAFDATDEIPPIDSVGAVNELFPGFAEAVDLDDVTLAPIGQLQVDELVCKTNRLRFAHDEDVKVGAALVAWYCDHDEPAVVEFSFRYEGDDVDNADAAGDSSKLLQLLATIDWRSDGGPTKTRWIYERAGIPIES